MRILLGLAILCTFPLIWAADSQPLRDRLFPVCSYNVVTFTDGHEMLYLRGEQLRNGERVSAALISVRPFPKESKKSAHDCELFLRNGWAKKSGEMK